MTTKIGPLPMAAGINDYPGAKKAAVACMLQALAYLDSDSTIPPIVGAHLQLAIDTLTATVDHA